MYPLPSSTTIPLSTLQAAKEMEAALKTSFRREMVIPQVFMEELSGFNAQNDDFSVDDLLDFSHVEEEEEEKPEPQQQQQQKQEEQKVEEDSVSEKQSHEICKPGTSSQLFKDEYASVPTTELSVPVDDVENLEWLSHFVEDSFSEFSAAAFPAVSLPENPKPKPEPENENPVFAQPSFKTPVQTKARSKRTRTGIRVWPLGSPETSSSSTTTTTTSSSSSSPSSPLLFCTTWPPGEQVCSAFARPPPAKKPKRNPCSDGGQPRRCSHCGVQKTPQWRTGPHGAKTLCNACGVRFKSGRLLPEYRPACSPTFSSELHSNHHRKVLEMRRKKEDGEIETGLSTVFPNF